MIAVARMHESVATGRGGFAKVVEVTVVSSDGDTVVVTVDTDGLYLKAGQTFTVPVAEIGTR
ncbi:hypothetical protein [Streptomyces hydrogenans]